MYIGLAVCLVAGIAATFLGGVQHYVGAPMIGLFLGILISNLFPAGFVAMTKQGAGFSSKYLLKTGIILVGGTLSFSQIIGVGLYSLPLICFNICLSFAVAYFAGSAIQVPGKTRVLVGGGTAICGGTAIATLAPIIHAEEEMAYALTAIFLFDIFAAIMFPYAAAGIGLSPEQYGILGGLAISDTSSVTAAAGTFDMIMGPKAFTPSGLSGGDMAIVVKLTRTTMLVVVAIVVMLVSVARDSRLERAAGGTVTTSFGRNVAKAFPFFILGFLALAILNTVLDFSTIGGEEFNLGWVCKKGYKYFITVALVGIGYKIKFNGLFTKGGKPFILGGITWLALAISCLVYVLYIM
ncbi:MAG: putative sulfate exporter family transporter [Firmicutes bacterium HGW-Firmicutes-11]|jgi:uncharacterized integral membrane protein (TIGR00698 family)|nr:MAG: putative sulfate exporter family transporter [Firmicutes bacterium HGW-Firmicutes-11]